MESFPPPTSSGSFEAARQPQILFFVLSFSRPYLSQHFSGIPTSVAFCCTSFSASSFSVCSNSSSASLQPHLLFEQAQLDCLLFPQLLAFPHRVCPIVLSPTSSRYTPWGKKPKKPRINNLKIVLSTTTYKYLQRTAFYLSFQSDSEATSGLGDRHSWSFCHQQDLANPAFFLPGFPSGGNQSA